MFSKAAAHRDVGESKSGRECQTNPSSCSAQTAHFCGKLKARHSSTAAAGPRAEGEAWREHEYDVVQRHVISRVKLGVMLNRKKMMGTSSGEEHSWPPLHRVDESLAKQFHSCLMQRGRSLRTPEAWTGAPWVAPVADHPGRKKAELTSLPPRAPQVQTEWNTVSTGSTNSRFCVNIVYMKHYISITQKIDDWHRK